MTRVLVSALAIGACGGNSNNGHPDASKQADAKTVDSKEIDAALPPDAPPATETPLPTGSPIVIPLKSLSQLSYTGPLTTGGQAQDVILDTGSTTLGVAGNKCTTCGVTPLYTPGKGAVDQKATADSNFADGTGWNSEIFSDNVALGTGPLVSMKFGDITTQNQFFRSFDQAGDIGYQGILGLGPDANLIQGTTSYLTPAFAGGVDQTIAFQLCADNGTMWLGGYDPTAQAGPQAVTPLVGLDQGIYGVNTADMAVAHKSLNLTNTDFGPTILDTGTSIAFIPASALTPLTAAIQASAGYQAVFGSQSLSSGEGCVTTTMTADQIDAMLPTIGIAFPGLTAGNSPFADLPATHSYLFPEGGQWCYGFEDSTQLFGNQFTASLFGDSVLQSWITTIDIGDGAVGFAPEQGCPESVADVKKGPAIKFTHDKKWWKQDPRVRTPDPVALQRKLGLHAH